MKIKSSKIKSIKSIGVRETFDIEIKHDCHNFIANGIVTHNSHACCYGYIAYADMYLKRHHPLQFMCSALQTRSRELYIKECGRLGIKILPPDVNKSDENYTVEGDSIRMGLSCIKHVGAKSKAIITRRPYVDEFQMIDRVKPNAKQIESLIYSGALDCFGDRSKIAKQFCKQGFHEEVTLGELAANEKEVLGFYLLHNPLEQFRSDLVKCVHPESLKQPLRASVGGMVSRMKEHQAKSGTMAFVTLLTDGGEMDVLIWPSDWQMQRKKVKIGNVIIASGKKTDKGNYAITDVRVLREQNEPQTDTKAGHNNQADAQGRKYGDIAF